MKIKLYRILLIVIIISIGCNSKEGASNSVSSQESYLLGPSDFTKKINSTEEAIILDVRTPREFMAGVIKGSVNLDFYLSDFSDQISKMDLQKTYFVYCHVGGRSRNVRKMMNQMGFNNVYDLKGGIVAWRKAGMEVVSP